MTIDLGFAWLTLPSGREISIVDVPGHEDFIRNMLAGVGGIDLALFVVAADEAVMPQTREHLAIIDLLEVPQGVVALTKSDLIDDAEWLELVQEDVHDQLAGTVLENATIIPVSALTGRGIRVVDRARPDSSIRHNHGPTSRGPACPSIVFSASAGSAPSSRGHSSTAACRWAKRSPSSPATSPPGCVARRPTRSTRPPPPQASGGSQSQWRYGGSWGRARYSRAPDGSNRQSSSTRGCASSPMHRGPSLQQCPGRRTAARRVSRPMCGSTPKSWRLRASAGCSSVWRSRWRWYVEITISYVSPPQHYPAAARSYRPIQNAATGDFAPRSSPS